MAARADDNGTMGGGATEKEQVKKCWTWRKCVCQSIASGKIENGTTCSHWLGADKWHTLSSLTSSTQLNRLPFYSCMSN